MLLLLLLLLQQFLHAIDMGLRLFCGACNSCGDIFSQRQKLLIEISQRQKLLIEISQHAADRLVVELALLVQLDNALVLKLDQLLFEVFELLLQKFMLLALLQEGVAVLEVHVPHARTDFLGHSRLNLRFDVSNGADHIISLFVQQLDAALDLVDGINDQLDLLLVVILVGSQSVYLLLRVIDLILQVLNLLRHILEIGLVEIRRPVYGCRKPGVGERAALVAEHIRCREL